MDRLVEELVALKLPCQFSWKFDGRHPAGHVVFHVAELTRQPHLHRVQAIDAVSRWPRFRRTRALQQRCKHP